MSNESGTDGSALPSRLSRREKLEARQRLTEWMHPDEMKAIFDTYWQRLDDHFFVQSGREFLRNAYGAAVFGRLRGATKVRLMPAACQKPDFKLLICNEVEMFELTEAYKPGRRRTEEAKVRPGQAENTISTHEEPKLDLLETSFALAECVIEKSQIKDYSKDTAPLTYLNRNHYTGDLTETAEEE